MRKVRSKKGKVIVGKKRGSIKKSKVDSEVLRKTKAGSEETDSYYGEGERCRRWFDWSNEAYKRLSEVSSLEEVSIDNIKNQIPPEYLCHISTLTNTHKLIKRELLEVLERIDDIRRSIYIYHKEDFKPKLGDLENTDL